MSEKRTLVRGIELANEESGEGHPFIWGHGMTSSRAAERRRGLLDMSAAATLARVIRYDARGHGESGWSTEPQDYTWSSLAQDMLGLADALGIDRFTAGGASMGCATSLFAALAAPHRIDRLVLVIPPTAWETRAGRGPMIAKAADFVRQNGVEALADLEDAEPLPEIFATDFPEKKAHDRASTLAMPADAFPFLLEGAGQCDFPSKDEVRGIAQPALILAWATDPVHPISTADALDQLLPNSHLYISSSIAEVREWPTLVCDFLKQA